MHKYLMKYITDFAPPSIKDVLLKKLLRTNQHQAQMSRIYPPSWLEWRASTRMSDIAIGLTLADDVTQTVAIDSWTTCEEAASLAISSLGIPSQGWTVVLDDSGLLTDSCGLDYILDLVSEKELCPAFPTVKNDLLRCGRKSSRQSVSSDLDTNNPKRPQVPPPEPPPVKSPSMAERELPIPSPQLEKNDRTFENLSRKPSHELLSRNSALNERYFDSDKSRSRSLDDLLAGDGPSEIIPHIEHETEQLSNLGLSGSRLNDRYHSTERLAPLVPRDPAPRYQKSQYAGRRTGGSHSSKYDRSEYATRSSAMSDTSEAPSLASHVRRVRVPSQASDVDQFLDELFSPVLDGSLDELSDARSLAASIRGSRTDINDFAEAPILDDDLSDLLSSRNLCAAIKGGGSDKDIGGSKSPNVSTAALDQEVENINNPEVSLDEYITGKLFIAMSCSRSYLLLARCS